MVCRVARERIGRWEGGRGFGHRCWREDLLLLLLLLQLLSALAAVACSSSSTLSLSLSSLPFLRDDATTAWRAAAATGACRTAAGACKEGAHTTRRRAAAFLQSLNSDTRGRGKRGSGRESQTFFCPLAPPCICPKQNLLHLHDRCSPRTGAAWNGVALWLRRLCCPPPPAEQRLRRERVRLCNARAIELHPRRLMPTIPCAQQHAILPGRLASRSRDSHKITQAPRHIQWPMIERLIALPSPSVIVTGTPQRLPTPSSHLPSDP